MAYSDYGGYAYRNYKRVEERSDATISPEGDIFGSPGTWPGFVAYATGGMEEVRKRRSWPGGHAVLGDGPIYVVLYKQSYLRIFRGNEELEIANLIKDPPVGALQPDSYSDTETHYLDTEVFKRTGKVCIFEVDGWRLEVFFREEDNHYQYARLAQPDGNVWHGWSGYGVGAGLEDCGYGFSTPEREEVMCALFPDFPRV